MERDPSNNKPQYTTTTRPLGRSIQYAAKTSLISTFPTSTFPTLTPTTTTSPTTTPSLPSLTLSSFSSQELLKNRSQSEVRPPLPNRYWQTYPVKSQVGLTGSQSRTIQEGSSSMLSWSGSDRWLPASKGIEAPAGFRKDFKKCQIHWTLRVNPWWPPSFAQLAAVPTTYGSSWRRLARLMQA